MRVSERTDKRESEVITHRTGRRNRVGRRGGQKFEIIENMAVPLLNVRIASQGRGRGDLDEEEADGRARGSE